MYTFIFSILALIAGYLFYGKFIEKVFGADPSRKTPAYTMQDGVDFIPMPTWKVYLIQFLNIAGPGPIFGAILGMLYGPAAYLWIVLGCIFGGAVHDYLAGVISLRKHGASLPEIIGGELGKTVRYFMNSISIVLMILVGAVSSTTPAGLLSNMTADWGVCGTTMFWIIVIMAYYFLATLLPISKLIGRIYPVFGFAILVMCVGVFVGIFTHEGYMPEITDAFTNHHPSTAMPIFPGICITIACGAISGFHATQSPLMARCLKNERFARPVFYGAMVTEGVVALIWAAASIKFANSLGLPGDTPYEQLLNVLTDNGTHTANPALLVNALCNSWIGPVGGVLAILGVVFAPITSGDTALRSGRLMLAEALHYRQNRFYKRILLAFPLLAGSVIVMLIDFQVLWRYFSWFNQTFSIFTLWAITVWLAKRGKRYVVSLVPALWMTMVCLNYILVAPEGLGMNATIGILVSLVVTLYLLFHFMHRKRLLSKRFTHRV